MRVTVTNHGKGAVNGEVRLNQPSDGRSLMPRSAAQLRSLVRTNRKRCDSCCAPARRRALGDYVVRASAATGDSEVRDQACRLSSTRIFDADSWRFPASVTVKVMDVRLAPNLSVGYVMGTGDEVPAALRGLGASVQLLDADAFSWADLSRYDAIFVGVRAYDSRPDLRANNKRILDYAASGGTVIVQYNRGNTWTQYAPFAAGFSNTRVTDENGQVQILSSDDPLFHFPNEIGEAGWRNWVQERGTYFMSLRISGTPT